MQQKTILVVDDSATSRLLFRAHLPENSPYVVHEADSLEGAMEKAVSIRPEVVVLDYNMPGQTGVEIAHAMLKAGINARFVLFTANTQKYILDEAMAAGFVAVIEKPVTREKINDMLEKVGQCN
ncbi:MAG: response regulator [Sideroxyarcus sp.]|nr:response regulator [Sideroxyarcus sp.]